MSLSETEFRQMSEVIEYGCSSHSRVTVGCSNNQPGLLQNTAFSDKPALFPVRPFPLFAAAAPLPRRQTGVIVAVATLTVFYFVRCTLNVALNRTVIVGDVAVVVIGVFDAEHGAENQFVAGNLAAEFFGLGVAAFTGDVNDGEGIP
jgi:hypothetical protein